MGKWIRMLWLTLCLLGLGARADIVIGQSVPLSGVAGEYGRNMAQGAQAYFNWLNKQSGGIHGEQIKYVQYDDGFDFSRTLANTRKLLAEDKVVALMGYFSSDATASIVSRRWLDGGGVPLVGVSSSARTVREPGSRFLFHTRASQREEIAKLMAQMKRLGIARIGVFYQDDGFGQDGLAAAQEEAKSTGIVIAASASYPANTLSVNTAVKRLADANPPAILMISITKPSGLFIKAFRRLDSDAALYHTSTVDFDELVRDIGPDLVHGLAIAQVYPYPGDNQNKLIKEFRSTLAAFAPSSTPPGYAALEGYITAKLLADAIGKAGPNPSRAKVYEALDNLGEVNYGGFRLSFGPNQRSGSHFVELTIANQKGELSK
ncbi:ABC transporter substrate-binding protein [Chitinimonas arctica]|uniref:ABC transporter substrate-binding protein n=1 Tax=Chitinimonas arctica TaxID=2594795 RepID=A0A516SGN2_9NEIS|nr:ABC transporter substrate-binding protein [Chitinimonas arctica]QDQ27324.1 ABC transporter substrate-binding protein [Chitinimonas arctica]